MMIRSKFLVSPPPYILAMTILTICLMITTCEGRPLSGEEQAERDARVYLEQYGYLVRQLYQPGSSDNRDIVAPLVKFQQMAGIRQTGVLDAPTQQAMDQPRCGVPDVGRYIKYGTKWNVTKYGTNLRYRIDAFPKSLSNHANDTVTVQSEIKRAWKLWANETPLTFQEVKANEKAEFIIKFGRGNHGDDYPFVGRGGVVAHAFFPPDGRVHFDDAEPWTVGMNSGIDLFYVAVHEFGHALGLEHSSAIGSVMTPYYHGYKANLALSSDDINGIQSLYGKKTKSLYGAPSVDSDKGDFGDEPPMAAYSGEFETVFQTGDDTLYGVMGM